MIKLKQLESFFEESQEKILNDWFTFLRFKSISSEPQYKKETRQCAQWVTDYLSKQGLLTQVWETSAHPVILAQTPQFDPKKPTLLFYNHYDVQPAKEDLWDTPPFEPTQKGEEVYARGAQDNKGQAFFTFLAVFEAMKQLKELPVNIKLCIEGDEETGSAGLAGILEEKKEELKADYIVVVDVNIPNIHTPAITLGVRGMCAITIELSGSSNDLHSGQHGGIAYNPLHALVELLNQIRCPKTGKILVPGFYDSIQPLTEEEQKQFDFSFNKEIYIKQFGCPPTGGEKSFSPLESNWVRPTIEINGIKGGYAEEGFMTVIPATATAKISCRLVVGQDPHIIAASVKQYLLDQLPQGIQANITLHPGIGKAVRTSPTSDVVQHFQEALTTVFDAPCTYVLQGGSIPITAQLAECIEADPIFIGLGLPDDQIHAPNEHFGVNRIKLGFLTTVLAIQNFQKK